MIFFEHRERTLCGRSSNKEEKEMFCKNCGSQIEDVAAVCVKCGAAKGAGNGFCAHCGQPLTPGAAVCMSCGVAVVAENAVPAGYNQKSKMVAGLLGIFLGAFGVHNFYLGYTGKAVAQLLISVLSCFTLAIVSEIWGLIEGIMVLTGSTKVDGKGVALKD